MVEIKKTHNSDIEEQRGSGVGEMRARREMMADEKRYIIYYTFGEPEEGQDESEAADEGV
jgi:hypothetical protein